MSKLAKLLPKLVPKFLQFFTNKNPKIVKITLRNKEGTKLCYFINAYDHKLAEDWIAELKKVVRSGTPLNKTFCFLGFPQAPRDLEYLCQRLNQAIYSINTYNWTQHGLEPYVIEEWFSPDVVRFGKEYPRPAQLEPGMMYMTLKNNVMNRLHNHFEKLQGTLDNESAYHLHAPAPIRKSIGILNTVCHEIESLVISQRKYDMLPEWIRPSQITTFFKAPRVELKPEHKKLFLQNGYDRVLGGVYMHWAQIGKTLFEVFRDENAPKLDATTCEAITHLKYYSGEFDIDWGRDIVKGLYPWHDQQIESFQHWLVDNQLDPMDENLSLGYLPIGQVDLQKSFGTTDATEILNILQEYLDIYAIDVDGVRCVYQYTWKEQDV
jgi:hypothetical protein